MLKTIKPLLLALVLVAADRVLASPVIDCRVDAAEIEGAERLDSLVQVVPFTKAVGRFPSAVYIKSAEQGIYIAGQFQQPGQPVLSSNSVRDADMRSDFFQIGIDFDLLRETGYLLQVSPTGIVLDGTVTKENRLNVAWDGSWESAACVNESGWSAELLVPWSMARMKPSVEGKRDVGIYLRRHVEGAQEDYAYPAIDSEVQFAFLSRFAALKISSYDANSFLVRPYASTLVSTLDGASDGNLGVDVNWNISPSQHVVMVVNPDFGQVESDDLVVSFDALETFFSEKRPFFIEDNSLFSVPLMDRNNLTHTKRIGGRSDGDSEAQASIDYATKYLGSFGDTQLGVMLADEDEESDKRFSVGRVVHSFSNASLGMFFSKAERPLKARQADVAAIDVSVRPTTGAYLNGVFLKSQIDRVSDTTTGDGMFLEGGYQVSERLCLTVGIQDLDKDVDFNDAGFMRRNNVKADRFKLKYNQSELDAGVKSRVWTLERQLWQNQDGDRLPADKSRLAMNQSFVNGNSLFVDLTWEHAGVDDVTTRGNGAFHLPSRYYTNFYFGLPRAGNWEPEYWLSVFNDEGLAKPTFEIGNGWSWYPSNDVTHAVSAYWRQSEEWLLWLEGAELGTFARRELSVAYRGDIRFAGEHELAAKVEWSHIRANGDDHFNVAGRELEKDSPLDDSFIRSEVRLQLRYTYNYDAYRKLYLVYSRGGLVDTIAQDKGVVQDFDEALREAYSDQILAKLVWAL